MEAPLLKPRAQSPFDPSWKVKSPLWSDAAQTADRRIGFPTASAKLSEPGLQGRRLRQLRAGRQQARAAPTNRTWAALANAYTLNTVEAMCLALMVDPQGDAEMTAAQAAIRAKLDEWIPIILPPRSRMAISRRGSHWLKTSAERRRVDAIGDHEGYVAGYFIEAAIAHFG